MGVYKIRTKTEQTEGMMTTGRGRKRQRIKYNPTVNAMRSGMMRFKRRIDVPMWHIEHLRQVIPVLKSATDELERLERSNSLRNVDKCIYAQSVLMGVNAACNHFKPHDPRHRGTEALVYDPHLIDTRGHSDLQSRPELDEPLQKPDDASGV